MLIRFASGSLVACVPIAIASLVTLVVFGPNPQQVALVLAIWCFVPCAWGLWAMLSPSGWVPRRLPVWGFILGILAGLMAIVVLNLPSRMLGISMSNAAKVLVVLLAGVFYYVLWMVVSVVYRQLLRSSAEPSRA